MVGWLVIAARIVPLVWTAVQAVERLVKGKGQEKQDAAVDLVGDLLATVEGAAGKDLLNDAAVVAAVRRLIDAVVAVQNVIATRSR